MSDKRDVRTETPATASGKVAIVTGASRGIGAAVARRLARDGAAVIVAYAGSRAAAEAVAAEIADAGGRAVAVRADVRDTAAVGGLFDRAVATYGGVDIVVNNAGIMALAPIVDSDDELFADQVAVNLRGTFAMMREAGRRLRAGGRIVNLSSSAIGLRLEGYGVYAATKAAVEAMTAIMAKEMRGRSVTVNAIAPGPTATDLFLNGKTPEQVARLAAMSPLDRLGTPEDIAAAVAFLAGPDGGWINGQTVRANGGLI